MSEPSARRSQRTAIFETIRRRMVSGRAIGHLCKRRKPRYPVKRAVVLVVPHHLSSADTDRDAEKRKDTVEEEAADGLKRLRPKTSAAAIVRGNAGSVNRPNQYNRPSQSSQLFSGNSPENKRQDAGYDRMVVYFIKQAGAVSIDDVSIVPFGDLLLDMTDANVTVSANSALGVVAPRAAFGSLQMDGGELATSGTWGMFDIELTVHFANGDTREMTHSVKYSLPTDDGSNYVQV